MKLRSQMTLACQSSFRSGYDEPPSDFGNEPRPNDLSWEREDETPS
ncbi:hypothetical protein RE6C_02390 [Rhodopirellula europaea 6C]|uniref:Uncharacterized protein n=1 Tax=Rhodopirellula europaea 6C TaxID=1263867 RepID=M2B551_9BACT|nr:hypothetical protein RE6C_02390 [Rhodopirellula europaea 6C]